MNSSILSSLSPTSPIGLDTLASMLNHLGGAKNPNCNQANGAPAVAGAVQNAATKFITQQTTTITEKGYSLTICLALFFTMVAFAVIGVVSTISWGAYQAELDASGSGSDEDTDESGRYTSGVLAAVFTTLTIGVAFALIIYLYLNAKSCKGKEFVSM